MGLPTNQLSDQERVAVSRASFDSRSQWCDLGFQFCLVWLLAASVWSLLGPVPQSAIEHRLRLAVVGSGFAASAGIWIASASWLPPFKVASISACLFAALSAGIYSSTKFDAGSRILAPAYVKQGRIVHEGLGLSYAMLPGHQVNLQPILSRSLSAPPNAPLKARSRLQFGEMAILSRIVQAPLAQKSTHGPSWVMLEVQMDRVANLNAFVRAVRAEEAKWAAVPNIRIVRHTHRTQVAGLESVEFEFLKEPERLLARQVFLRTGACVLNFMLNTEEESDRPMLEEFLKSIRLDSKS